MSADTLHAAAAEAASGESRESKETADRHKPEKISHFHSFAGKTSVFVVILAVAAVFILMFPTVKLTQKYLRNAYLDYLLDKTITTGQSIEKMNHALGNNLGLEASSLQQLSENAELTGLSSSYCYVVDKDGTMLYHPTAEKIGQPVENAVIKNVIAEMQEGKHPQSEVVTYTFQGTKKEAAYYVDQDNSFVVCITADQSDIFSGVYKIARYAIIAGASVAVLATLIVYLLLKVMLRPVGSLNRKILKLSDLDFTDDEETEKMAQRKDEFGEISRNIKLLQSKLSIAVGSIKKQSGEIFSSSNGMHQSAADMSAESEQIDHAVGDIAQGATSQASETQKAENTVVHMGELIEDTTGDVEKLTETAGGMKKSQETAMQILSELGEVNQKTRASVEQIAEQTRSTNTSAAKISEVTGLITDIAEETNLLSLNASIEAARAGEAGRGFAVVASQIQKLADQSSNSAKQIQDIIDQLVADSNRSVETMESVQQIIAQQSDDVDRTSRIFSEVSNGIDAALEAISSIDTKVRDLGDERTTVVDVVNSLTAIAEENAASTQESSASMTQISELANGIAESSGKLKDVAEEMNVNMSHFKVDAMSAEETEQTSGKQGA